MLVRFDELASAYRSDIERLKGLEEGSFLLRRFAGMTCPLCGAEPAHQHVDKEQEDVESLRIAATAEICKIAAELTDLEATMAAVRRGQQEILDSIRSAAAELVELEKEIERLKPLEREGRSRYDGAMETRSMIEARRTAFADMLSFQERIVDLEKQSFGRQKASGLRVGLDTSSAYDFSQMVKAVLTAWQYPEIGDVHFDPRAYDIVVNGKERADNGKGVRAILHSAFKVALLLHCRAHDLPHPGFVVLDSPLLTYRGPVQIKKYGELAEDEKRFKDTDLNVHFYRHLASIRDLGQIVVLENKDPPDDVADYANVLMFSGAGGDGRQGFFPSTNQIAGS